MQNELTNVAQQKLLNNKHLAFRLRTQLRQNLSGCETALAILGDLTDEQLIAKYLANNAIKCLSKEEIARWVDEAS